MTKVFSRVFLVKTLEETAVVFFATLGSAVANGQPLTKSALLAAGVGGLRAVYGIFVKDIGQPQSPVVK